MSKRQVFKIDMNVAFNKFPFNKPIHNRKYDAIDIIEDIIKKDGRLDLGNIFAEPFISKSEKTIKEINTLIGG